MILLFFSIILVFSTISILTSALVLINSSRISYGISVNNVPLSGLSKEAALEKLKQAYAKITETSELVQLHYQDQSWSIHPQDIDFKIDMNATVNKAYLIGRNKNILQGFIDRADSAINGKELPVTVTYDEDKLKTILRNIAKKTDHPSKNAECNLSAKGELLITPEVLGQVLPIDEVADDLKNFITTVDLPKSIQLTLTESPPQITTNDLKSIDTILSSYSTKFNNGNYNRSENIRIAAASLNHVISKPDETTSFNALTGLRLAESGYQEAPVLIDGKSVPDIGGGVCQVSSTLYNAILLANLKSVERTSHFYPSAYVPMGLDATVADHLLDFKFQNNLKHPIYLLTQVSQGTLSIYIAGNHEDFSLYKISLQSIVDKTTPPSITFNYDKTLPTGRRITVDSGKTGYTVSAYRLKLQNGQEIDRELLHTDTYSPENKVILIGTR
ncbi:Vancomycin resistance protein YoaR, contains peptidoglycan-binding and VanW domains [Propionispira arboris]|uniref:Vancomycin resistance protein YoaR, contains peptidoglycan-binding and VanW domains n=1 Tax=Propionispira arboris TaxID=84035 RepID=A0A1H7BGR7_9FIRM|nr:VanW family protein [Propionispira arboris]SEJ76396.1 Vancomycin resistance protein YoaR, contains peptidoglycan-binding and VanW domains [Propionispira arboris]